MAADSVMQELEKHRVALLENRWVRHTPKRGEACLMVIVGAEPWEQRYMSELTAGYVLDALPSIPALEDIAAEPSAVAACMYWNDVYASGVNEAIGALEDAIRLRKEDVASLRLFSGPPAC